jgi:hypothetical protein
MRRQLDTDFEIAAIAERQGGTEGGQTAAFVDQSEATADRLPLFIGGVLALSFVLLLLRPRAPSRRGWPAPRA